MMRSTRAKPFCSRARRERCSTSTTAPIPTSPPRTPPPAAWPPALASLPLASPALSASRRRTPRASAAGPSLPKCPISMRKKSARGNEFGAVTGRPRRCGWLDLVVLRYAMMLSGIDSMVVTKLDVFDHQAEIQVCTGYRYKGKPLKEMPPDVETLSQVEPDYKTLPGWQKPTPGIRDVKDLPEKARDYLSFISDQLQVEIGMISTGPERDATIVPRGTKLASWL